MRFALLLLASILLTQEGIARDIYFSNAPGTGGRQTLIQFTDEAGEAGIVNSQKLFGSTGSKHARFGDGQYFTDIVPANIGAARIADLTADQVAAGQRSLGQVSSELFGVPW